MRRLVYTKRSGEFVDRPFPIWRLWVWYENAPEDRVGGPWWHHDFDTESEARRHAEALRPMARGLYLLKTDEADVAGQDSVPPQSAEAIVASER